MTDAMPSIQEPGLTGLQQLQALIASGTRPSIAETLDFDLVEVELGRVVFEATPGQKAFNPMGGVHGGYSATLLDSACGSAVHSRLSATQGYTTVELKVSFHRPIDADGGPVRAEGSLISFGRRVAFASAALTDAAGRVLSTATSTLLVFDR